MGLAPLIELDAGLHGLDLGMQIGQRGQGGSEGYQWGPETTSFLVQALNSGQPISDVMRTPGQGLFKYGLSKLGILSPQVHANADQMALEGLALKQQSTQQAGQFGDIFSQAAKIAGVDPGLAGQFYQREQKQIPSLGPVDPNTFKNIFTRAQLAQQLELLKFQHEKFWEDQQIQLDKIREQQLGISEKREQDTERRLSDTEARTAASEERTTSMIDQGNKRLQQQADIANNAQALTLWKDIYTAAVNSSDKPMEQAALANLRTLVSRYNMTLPAAGASTTPSSKSIPGFGPAPTPSAARPAPTIPW